MTSHDHVGENAELYALGALDEPERQQVLDHAATCRACTKLLGDAEQSVAFLDSLAVPHVAAPAALDERFLRTPRRWSMLSVQRNVALAASLALFAGGALATHDALVSRATLGADDAALRVLSESHFNHATFQTVPQAGFIAKAIFGRSPKGWIYIVTDTGACGCRAVGIEKSSERERELGPFVQQGSVSTLFVPDAADVVKVDLRSGNATIGSVHITR